MPASDPYPYGVDPVHVWAVCVSAAPGIQQGGAAMLIGGQHAARLHLPDRASAHAVHAALQRVGYQAGRMTGPLRGRGLVVAGWSADGLESRLTAMRGVLHTLAAEPGATAEAAVERLCRFPAADLPGLAGQRLLIRRAGEQLRAWISRTSGIHALADPRARPTDPGCALRLAATRRAEEAIDDLALRHVQVAELAVALYPALRQRMYHDSARHVAIQRAAVAFHLSPRLGQDLTPLTGGTARAPGAAAPRPAAPLSAIPRAAPPGPVAGPWLRAVQDLSAGSRPPLASRPPAVKATRPRGRTFPSGRARRHP